MESNLQDLIVDASILLSKINEHPEYKALILKGYQPDLNLADAQSALTYLMAEIAPELIEESKS